MREQIVAVTFNRQSRKSSNEELGRFFKTTRDFDVSKKEEGAGKRRQGDVS